MTRVELARLGLDMRRAQTKLANTPTTSPGPFFAALQTARDLEAEFDRAVRKVLEQGTLFGDSSS